MALSFSLRVFHDVSFPESLCLPPSPLQRFHRSSCVSPIYPFVADDESGWIPSTHFIDTTMSQAPWINHPVWPNGSLRVACVPTTVSHPQLDPIPSHQQLILRTDLYVYIFGLIVQSRVESRQPPGNHDTNQNDGFHN